MRRAAVALVIATACVAGNGTIAPPNPETLVRPGARVVQTRMGDLDGDGSAEAVISSVSEAPNAFGFATPYLEVFAQGEDAWQRVFDATGHAPTGEETPDVMLQPADEGFASAQTVDVLELLDFAGDGSSEIVAAISNVGATSGPLELWIISMEDQEPLAEYYTRTERGGNVGVGSSRVTLEFGVYRKKDAGCCPSILEVRTIGYDPASGRILTLDLERRRMEAA